MVDLGPGAGEPWRRASSPQGTPARSSTSTDSLTGQYLTGARRIEIPEQRRAGQTGQRSASSGASENNLQDVTRRDPAAARFICVTGVSRARQVDPGHETSLPGRGAARCTARASTRRRTTRSRGWSSSTRSSTSTSRRSAARRARTRPPTPACSRRSATLRRACRRPKARGYKPGRFCFNVKGGRCEACQGDGVIKIEMHFLPDVYVPCEVCNGHRYNRETLEVKYQGQDDRRRAGDDGRRGARVLRGNVPAIRDKLASAGRRRPRLPPARPAGDHALGRRGAARQAGRGAAPRRHRQHPLHPRRADHRPALRRRRASCSRCCIALVDQGNTVVVIEHNLDVIKSADWIIDLGPDGGDRGGRIVAAGTPEDVARVKESRTAEYLAPYLKQRTTKPARKRA